MNPIDLARKLVERYRKYLMETFHFKDPVLRDSFERALREWELCKGPFLEAAPSFRRTRRTRDLLADLAGTGLDQAFSTALDGDRLLYEHQDDAIRKVVSGRNVVVATGTGSGKTEAFLYPILLDLYKEFQTGSLGPGVRALVLYPMNALANDQRERLGEIAKRLKNEGSRFAFTFGQYTGQTPKDQHDRDRNASEQLRNRLEGELVLRTEMQERPPHILLTNYSMLEYLLLRPQDSPLFDDGRSRWWKFLVIDEAHQYRGSRGTEMAMLLRRLKRRLKEGGRSEPFRCIATSATLLGKETDRSQVAQFASELFGEPFDADSVILGRRQSVPDTAKFDLGIEEYGVLQEILTAGTAGAWDRLRTLAARFGVTVTPEGLSKAVGCLLQFDERVVRLRKSLSQGPKEAPVVAQEIFPDMEKEAATRHLSTLVDLLVRSVDPETGSPLLSARYHLLVRSLEGAFVSYVPHKSVFLDRQAQRDGHVAFEVALCRECGQHYFVGQADRTGFREAVRDPSDLQFGATFYRPLENGEELSEDEKYRKQLCVECGKLDAACGHSALLDVAIEPRPEGPDRPDQVQRCGACGYNAAGRDPVREVVHGTDGPHAVLATTLYQELPNERRKILAFADGRQDAAFFAWYLDDSYEDILARNVLLAALRNPAPGPNGLTLSELARRIGNEISQRGIVEQWTGEEEIRTRAWTWLFREFLTEEVRISLEGVGLLRWGVKLPTQFQIPRSLLRAPWSLTPAEAREVIFLLLDSMRLDRAVELPSESPLRWHDLNLEGQCIRVVQNETGNLRSGERAWCGSQGDRGRRLDLMKRILLRNGLGETEALEKARSTLREIWDALDAGVRTPTERLWLAVDGGRRLNPAWWVARPVAPTDRIFRCQTCGRLQGVSVRSVCTRYRCPGILEVIQADSLRGSHYRDLYESKLPGVLRVEEHTAQLHYEKARSYQSDFKEGRIHVLSCSTTFELGVDLGDLDTVFLRNVPPEPFNYAQRVGRAGRRPGYPGFAVTHCRRNPHDLYHFADPERIFLGATRPPTLSIRNERILTRHVAAVAFSAYFRQNPETFENVKSFLGDLANPQGVSRFRKFLYDRRAEIEASCRDVVPLPMHEKVGLNDGSWIEKIAGQGSRFSDAEAEISSDYRNLQALRKELFAQGMPSDAVTRRLSTVQDEDVLSFLSRKAVIPKYGFPVDVVELDTRYTGLSADAGEITLERDLSIAIAEFAPSSEVIANKRVWTSYGLKKVPEKEWEEGSYRRCQRHNFFHAVRAGAPRPGTSCCRDAMDFPYVMPRFGFAAVATPKKPRGRPWRPFATRPYFAGSLGRQPDPVSLPPGGRLVAIRPAHPGSMFVVCEGRQGRGFYVCKDCGAGFRKPKNPHQTSLGRNCRGTLLAVALAHEFVTDVLEVRFPQVPSERDDWFSHSLAYALLEGAADVLEVPRSDLSVTVVGSGDAISPIVLYDNVPGGAGLVARLADEAEFKSCLESARRRVSGMCGCGASSSCYGCLRNYSNQFAHPYLRRGPVCDFLASILSAW